MNQVPRVAFEDGYSIPRVIIGGWQLSEGHSEAALDQAGIFATWSRLVDLGFDTFDCADIYRGVEPMLGAFSATLPPGRRIQVHTKFVPDLNSLATISKAAERIERSLRRLKRDRLDLVQFHWWDYAMPRYVEVAAMLAELQREGKIARIGLTNFDTTSAAEIIQAGIPIAAHQVQYSVLDTRPAHKMAALCRRHRVALLCYGTVAGGFLSGGWRGAPAPPDSLENRSLVKYRLVIEEYGGWHAFQELLEALAAIAAKHGVSISNVAVRANARASAGGGVHHRHPNAGAHRKQSSAVPIRARRRGPAPARGAGGSGPRATG